MKAEELSNQLILSPISAEDLFSFISSLIKEQVYAANKEFLISLNERYPFEEILTLEELCARFKREAPTVKKAIVALGIVPHSYDEKAKPLYIYSEVIKALKNAEPAEWFNREREKFLSNQKGTKI